MYQCVPLRFHRELPLFVHAIRRSPASIPAAMAQLHPLEIPGPPLNFLRRWFEAVVSLVRFLK
jgi:hypothetical protein